MSQPLVPVSALFRQPDPDVEVQAMWLYDLVAPCNLKPDGDPGLLLITDKKGSRVYAVLRLGRFNRRTKQATFYGYRLMTDRGEFYDVDVNAPGGPTCDCADHTFALRRAGCRHLCALRLVGELPELEPLEQPRKVVEGRLAQPAQLEAAEGDGFDQP